MPLCTCSTDCYLASRDAGALVYHNILSAASAATWTIRALSKLFWCLFRWGFEQDEFLTHAFEERLALHMPVVMYYLSLRQMMLSQGFMAFCFSCTAIVCFWGTISHLTAGSHYSTATGPPPPVVRISTIACRCFCSLLMYEMNMVDLGHETALWFRRVCFFFFSDGQENSFPNTSKLFYE